MAENENKAKKPLFIAVFVILSQVVLVLSLLLPSTLTNAIESELSMMVTVYGEDKTLEIYSSAADQTETLMYDSGVVDYLRKMFLPKQYLLYGEVQDQRVFDTGFWNVIDSSINNLALTIEFTYIRIYSLGNWIYMFVIMAAAAIGTGYMQREIKKQGFDYSSPLKHGLSRKWIYLTPVVLYMVAVMPVAIHPYIYPTLMGVLSFAILIYVSNTIKRV
jgi:hypothetical protein